MDALLLALLLGLALDQGDRSQRLVQALDRQGALPVSLIVILGAATSAVLGFLVAPYLPGKAGLLFFAAALVFGAIGLIVFRAARLPAAGGSRGALYLQLALHRLSDRSGFLIVGVAAMTGNVWASAIGGAIGGLGALLPPLLTGTAYEKAVRLRLVAPILGVLLLLVGLGSGLGALGLL